MSYELRPYVKRNVETLAPQLVGEFTEEEIKTINDALANTVFRWELIEEGQLEAILRQLFQK